MIMTFKYSVHRSNRRSARNLRVDVAYPLNWARFPPTIMVDGVESVKYCRGRPVKRNREIQCTVFQITYIYSCWFNNFVFFIWLSKSWFDLLGVNCCKWSRESMHCCWMGSLTTQWLCQEQWTRTPCRCPSGIGRSCIAKSPFSAWFQRDRTASRTEVRSITCKSRSKVGFRLIWLMHQYEENAHSIKVLGAATFQFLQAFLTQGNNT